MRDGSRIEFSPTGSLQTYKDVNGNTNTFDTTTRTWTDTLGREISDPLPVSPFPSNIGSHPFTLPGLAGQPVSYTQAWNYLKPNGCVDGTEQNCVDSALENPTDPLYNQGTDTCEDRSQDHPLSPSLFTVDPPPYMGPQSNEINRWYDITNKIRQCFGLFNPAVLTEVGLPDGTKYRFRYNRYGEITKIIYPTGAYERFRYDAVAPLTYLDTPFDQANRGVVERWISEDGVTETQHWRYQAQISSVGVDVTTVNPDNSKSVMTYYGGNSRWGFEEPREGMAFEEKVYSEPLAENDETSRRLVKRVLNDVIVAPPRPGGNAVGTRDARTDKSVSITFENGKALATLSTTDYDDGGSGDPEFFSHLNAKRKRGYQFKVINPELAKNASIADIAALFSSSDLAVVSETDYSYDPAYKTRGILGRPVETRSLNPLNPNDVLAETHLVYDEANYLDDSYTTTNWENPNSTLRGNVTTARTWVKETNSWLESHTKFDNFGNVRRVWDVSGDTGKFVETQYDSTYHYAYPTSVIAPSPALNSSDSHSLDATSTITTHYDFTTGLPLSVTDDIGQTTTTEYDNMLRPIRVNPVVVNGVATGPITETIYGQPNPATGELDPSERFVKVRKQLDANNWDEATTWFDGLGRTIKTQGKDSQGDVFVETHYDEFGRADRVTNPYRSGDMVYWSKTRFDELGRAVESYAPATIADINANNLISLGTTSFDLSSVPGYFGTVVETTDAANKKSRSITNALGQLIVVEEPDSNGNLQPLPTSTPLPPPPPTPTPTPGSTPSPTPVPTPTPGGGGEGGGCLANCQQNFAPIDYPSYATYYTYNAQGKMVQVTQGVQNRYFKYDSLGRLIRVSQPEQEANSPALDMADAYNTSGHWTAGFTYDVLGNVITATDAKGTVITNAYDRAGRVITRSYSNEPAGQQTPAVNFYYDGKGLDTQQSPNFAKGKLTKVENGISQTRYTGFDNFGRLLSTEQRTPLEGQTIAQATPYVSSYQYNLSGALVQETYPSGRVVKSEFESDGDLSRIYGKTASGPMRTYASSFTYTPDGKIEQLRLGNGLWEKAIFNNRLQVTELNLGHGVDGDLWKLGYQYGEIDANGNVDASKNTGNIARQTLSFNGLAQPFIQSYQYDSLYRLTEAKETNSGSQTWKEIYAYDRYGNRSSHAKFNGATQFAPDNHSDPTIDPNTNRFNPNQGYTYDKNGNLIVDADSRGFTFNGDNKQTKVIQNGQLVGEYFYDGEGKRVEKKAYDSSGVLDEITVFVYSSGKLIAEYSAKPPPQNPTTSYTATDQLGSPRVITNALGEVVSRRDFMPFGEAIGPDGLARISSLKYNFGDDIRQKFTGYQKDEETGLDFAEARMYQNLHGRFTAVDPLLASGKSANPQSFNRFVYVLNNPLSLTDPTGLQVGTVPKTPFGHWYKPEGGGSPVFTFLQPAHSEPITTRNRHGDLVYTPIGAKYDEVTNLPLTVIRLREDGPQISLPVTDARTGQTAAARLSDFDRRGWEPIAGDQLATGAIQDVSLELFLGVEGGISLARGIGGNVFAGASASSMVSEEVGATKFWSQSSFEGTRVYQRNDIFDPDFVSSWKEGGVPTTGTNVERMASGRAPMGVDGEYVNLHHMIQTDSSPLAEVTTTFHRANFSRLHINPRSFGSGISRPAFDAFRERYWANRALDFKLGH